MSTQTSYMRQRRSTNAVFFERYDEDFTQSSMCITDSAGNFCGTAC